MKLAILAGLSFTFLGIGLSYKVPDGTSNSKFEKSHLSQPTAQGAAHGIDGIIELYREVESRGYKGNHGIHHRTLQGHPGKGAYGGANDVHKPPQTKSAASITAEPSLVSTAILLVSIGFFISQIHY